MSMNPKVLEMMLVKQADLIDRLRAELAELRAYCNCDERIDISHADALNAIARVSDLFARPWVGYDTAQAFAADVLRALEGDRHD